MSASITSVGWRGSPSSAAPSPYPLPRGGGEGRVRGPGRAPPGLSASGRKAWRSPLPPAGEQPSGVVRTPRYPNRDGDHEPSRAASADRLPPPNTPPRQDRRRRPTGLRQDGQRFLETTGA